MGTKNSISGLLAYGDIGAIAEKVGLSLSATSAAIKRGNPGHPAVREAVRIVQQTGALSTAQVIAEFTAVK
jgi:hypothetical protein